MVFLFSLVLAPFCKMNITYETLKSAKIQVEFLSLLGTISDFIYNHMIFIIGIPQLILNISVVLLILWSSIKSSNR